jgi:effector-binding domain-containing protein
MKNYFSIGQMAKLHNIPIKTLRYYDEIKLFCPVYIDSSNNYRYYSIEQSEHLNTITYLKTMGISLKNIKQHLQNLNINGFLKLLEEQKRIAENRIQELTKIKARLEIRIYEVAMSRNSENIGKAALRQLDERKVIRLSEKICSDPELEMGLRKLEKSHEISNQIFIGKVGLTVSKDYILQGVYEEYNSLFVFLEDNSDVDNTSEVLPKGNYACIRYRGTRKDSPVYYKILLEYIENNSLEITGDSIERVVIDQFITNDKSYFLTEIQIPVK